MYESNQRYTADPESMLWQSGLIANKLTNWCFPNALDYHFYNLHFALPNVMNGNMTLRAILSQYSYPD